MARDSKVGEEGKPRGARPDEDGGEVVTVTITVNNTLEFYRSAVITGEPGGPVRRYKTDDGDVINHNISTGYKELAKKMINK